MKVYDLLIKENNCKRVERGEGKYELFINELLSNKYERLTSDSLEGLVYKLVTESMIKFNSDTTQIVVRSEERNLDKNLCDYIINEFDKFAKHNDEEVKTTFSVYSGYKICEWN